MMILSIMMLRITALSVITPCIIDFIATLSIMTLCIMTIRNGLHCNTQLKTLRIMKFRIMHLIATLNIMTLSKETLSIIN